MHLISGPWPVRVTWALLPLVLGPALGDALGEHSLAVARTGSILAWVGWVGVLVAVLLPSTVSLTALRIAAPAALAAANWAALAGSRGLPDVMAVSGSALVVVTAFSPVTGDLFVNGSSYGDEHRLPLRVPGPILFGPLPLAWASVVAGPVAGALLLAAEQWWLGAVVLATGITPAALAGRALHGLSRRWLVLVPAGLVLHDHHALMEPVLFPLRSIRRLGPATTDVAAEAIDLTQGAFGLALALELDAPVEVSPRRRDKAVQVRSVSLVLVAPTRPGALLGEAKQRRIPVA